MSTEPETSSVTECDTPTKVELEHWFFHKVDGIRFQTHEATGQPGVVVILGKNESFLPLSSVIKEFDLRPETPDGRTLAAIGKGLKYVKGLLLGDPLPKEILTGEATWSLAPVHLKSAHQRVAMLLLGLVSDAETPITDPSEFAKRADDPVIKRKVNEAFTVAAEQLGLAASQKQEVVEYVNTLASELGYVEALRERLFSIDQMRVKIQSLRKRYSREPLVRETVDQVARLIGAATKLYTAIFKEVDAHVSDIISMLRDLESEIKYIRRHRDDLHVRFMAWDDILMQWAAPQVEFSMKATELIQATHRFLAPRFMTFTDWLAVARSEQKKRSGRIQTMHW